MNKVSIAGFVFLVGGITILIFQGIGSMMRNDYSWESMSLAGVTDYVHEPWLEKIDWPFLATFIEQVFTMPLYILLFIVGGILLLISFLFIKN